MDLQLLTVAQVCDRLQVRRTTFYSLRARQDFPKPIAMTKRSVRYRADEVDAWIRAVQEQSSDCAA